MRIGITGGTGFLGRSLAAACLGRGDEVVVFSRDPERAESSLGNVLGVRWNPGFEPAPADALESLDAVVHLAGEPIAGGRWNEERKRRIRSSRLDGTRHLAETWSRIEVAPRVLVSGSAIGYYGDRGDTPVDEDAGPGGDFLAEVTRDWEAAAMPVRDSGTRLVLLRTGLVLDRTGGALARMLLPFRLGLGGRLGGGRQWMSWIHLRDWTNLVLRALDDASVQGPLNAVAPGAVTNAEFTRTLARMLRRPAILPVPGFALRLLFGELADTLLGGQRVLPARAREHGFAFAFEKLEPALRDLLD